MDFNKGAKTKPDSKLLKNLNRVRAYQGSGSATLNHEVEITL